MKKINFFFALLLTFIGATPLFADTADFENSLPEGWQTVGTMYYYERPKTGDYSIGNSSGSGWDTNRGNYITTTKLKGNISLWLRSYKSGSTGYVVLFKLNDKGEVGDKLIAFSSSSTTFSEKTYTLTEPTRLAIVINYAHLDNMTYTEHVATVPEMNIDITNVSFGKVAADASKTITVSNVGAGTLTATISSDNDMFEVSKSSVSVEAGASESFDITFKYDAEVYGGHSANITLTPNAGDAQVITASASTADPTVWTEDFSGNADGWEVGEKWSITKGVAKAEWASTKGYLITPKLQVKAGEELEFEYRGTAYGTTIKIETSKDEGDWTQCASISVNSMSEFETYTIEGLTTGVYRIRFMSDDYELDNFSGFHLAALEHDMAITDSNIPTSGDTNDEYIATVTVQEKAGKDETVTARLYIDGTVVAEQEQTVAANETATIQISFTPTEAVSYKKAYIEVSYGDNSTVKTDETTISINTMLVIDEATANTFETYSGKVKLNYTVYDGWNTIALPFMVSDLSVFGTGAKVYSLTGYNNGSLQLTSATSMASATPYVLYVETATTEPIVFNNVSIYSNTAAEADCNTTKNGATFQGTYKPIEAGSMNITWYGVTGEGKIMKAGSSASIKAMHAYFTLPEGDEAKTIAYDGIVAGDDGTATAINALLNGNSQGELYDLSGRRVEGNVKAGIYVRNGKKIVIK